jgi:hypothetical protein
LANAAGTLEANTLAEVDAPEVRASGSRTVCRTRGADPALPPFLAEAASNV